MKLLKNILKALSYIHHLGFIHRDLKPENILFKYSDNDYLIEICDFGFSCNVKDNLIL
jgi:serine/threonine protein kinase